MRTISAKLKSGHMLQIEAVNLAGNTVTFPLPLVDDSGNSFEKANDGPPDLHNSSR